MKVVNERSERQIALARNIKSGTIFQRVDCFCLVKRKENFEALPQFQFSCSVFTLL